MDIEALKCFIKLYEEKNFTKAAKDLFTSQQALSRTRKERQNHPLGKRLPRLLLAEEIIGLATMSQLAQGT